MIAPFSKFKEDLREVACRAYSERELIDFEGLLMGWECYADLKVDKDKWWEAFHWDPKDNEYADYGIPPRMTQLSINELFVKHGFFAEGDIALIRECKNRIARTEYETKNLTYPAGSVSLLFKAIDAAYALQVQIGDNDLYGILDI